MPGEWKRNPVHKVVFNQADGIIPICWQEGCVVVVTGLLLLKPLGGVFATVAAMAVALGLIAWRSVENNRPEYALILWRRVRRGPRCYNAVGPDTKAFWKHHGR